MVKLHLTNPLFTNNRTPIIEMGQTFDFGRSFWNATVKQRLQIQGLYNLFFAGRMITYFLQAEVLQAE